MRGLVLALVVCACAPAVDGPVEKQHALDRVDSERVTTQLLALPGVVRAEVILHRPIADPLSASAPSPATSSIVLVVDDRADHVRLETQTRALARAVAPDVDPTIVVEVGAKRAQLASVGPFMVEASSKKPLKAVLAIALAVIAALAMWIAWVYRPRRLR